MINPGSNNDPGFLFALKFGPILLLPLAARSGGAEPEAGTFPDLFLPRQSPKESLLCPGRRAIPSASRFEEAGSKLGMTAP
jgi:hypothetical protein